MILATTTIGGVAALVALRPRGPATAVDEAENGDLEAAASTPSTERLAEPGGEPTQ